jgi:hypothetical protein
MATAIARDQHVWDCRWSKLSHRLAPENEPDHRETLWLCTREPGMRRPVIEEECAVCPRWELDPHNQSIEPTHDS